jgi:hypothetical protein
MPLWGRDGPEKKAGPIAPYFCGAGIHLPGPGTCPEAHQIKQQTLGDYMI